MREEAVRFFCIGDEETVAGFRLAGVEGRTVATPDEARAALAEVLLEHDCGVVIMTERIADAVKEEVQTVRFGREYPLIVEIPGPDGALPGHRSVREVVQEAVGMRIS
jgi:V/A-type H+-transporting ATPase subunit F